MGTGSHTEPLAAGAPVIAKAHHGSVSKEQRLGVERELAAGELRCVVATASLELGIDIGSVDLVLQVAPPAVGRGGPAAGGARRPPGGRAAARRHLSRGAHSPGGRRRRREGMRAGRDRAHRAGVQRPGRAGPADGRRGECGGGADGRRLVLHRHGGRPPTPRCRARPSTRSWSCWPAASPRRTWRTSRRGSCGTAPPVNSAPGPARSGWRWPSSGTIPDRGMFPVVLPEGARTPGGGGSGSSTRRWCTEPSPGDIITLGTSSWRIGQITGDRVVVDPAEGRSARLPFWKGEGLGRPAATGLTKGVFLREAQDFLPSEAGAGESEGERALRRRLTEAGLDDHARANLLALLREQYRATGALPTDETLVLERYEDESGSWRVIVHSTLGRRVHEPWAMAIRERVHQLLGVRPQTIVADDGIVLQIPQIPPVEGGLPPGPGSSPSTPRRSPPWCAAGSRRRRCSRPGSASAPPAPCSCPPPARGTARRCGCSGSRPDSYSRPPASSGTSPVSVEAARECLQQYYDLPALTDLMERLASGRVRVVEAVTSEPSPFAHPLLFGYASTLIYQEDLPHAERRAQLLSLDPKALSPPCWATTASRICSTTRSWLRWRPSSSTWPPAGGCAPTPRRIADLLRELGPLSAAELAERCTDVDQRDPGEDAGGGADGAGGDVEARGRALSRAGGRAGDRTHCRAGTRRAGRARRATTVRVGGRELWARVEDAPALRRALGAEVPTGRWSGPVTRSSGGRRPLTAERPASALRAHPHDGDTATRGAGLRAGGGRGGGGPGRAGRGRFPRGLGGGGVDGAGRPGPGAPPLPGPGAGRHRAGPPAALQRLVLERAGLDEPGGGVDALAEALAALEGVWLPAGLWESVVLPARVADYRPAMLDELIAAGEVVWQARPVGDAASRSGSARARSRGRRRPRTGRGRLLPHGLRPGTGRRGGDHAG